MKTKKGFYFLICLGLIYNLIQAVPEGKDFFEDWKTPFCLGSMNHSIFTQPVENEI